MKKLYNLDLDIESTKPIAPRVTLSDLEANIIETEIVKHVSKSGQILRWAVLTTKNGFAATGDPSASASPENDVPKLGEERAIENAKSQLWKHMAYELCTNMKKE